MTFFLQWLQMWKQRHCQHGPWRPAVTSTGPARACEKCWKQESLTEAEFYAEFGRMPKTLRAMADGNTTHESRR